MVGSVQEIRYIKNVGHSMPAWVVSFEEACLAVALSFDASVLTVIKIAERRVVGNPGQKGCLK